MNAAYEKLIQHLDEHNVRYATCGDDRSIFADFRGEVGTYRFIAQIDEDGSLFQVFGHQTYACHRVVARRSPRRWRGPTMA